MADWRDQAKCRGLSPAEAERLFFPGKGQSTAPGKAFCRGLDGHPACPVLRQCLAYAMKHERHHPGIWGGTSDKDRRKIHREGQLPDVLVPIAPLRDWLRETARGWPSIAAMCRSVADQCDMTAKGIENWITHPDRETVSLKRARLICKALGHPDVPGGLWPEFEELAS